MGREASSQNYPKEITDHTKGSSYLAIMRLAAVLRRSIRPGTRPIFSFFRRKTDLDRLKADLEVSLQSGKQVPAAESHLALAAAYLRVQQPQNALPHITASSSLLKQLPSPSLQLLHHSAKMAMETLAACGRLKEALAAAEESLSTARGLFGPTDVELARTLYGVSYVKAGNGLNSDAEALCKEVVHILRQHRDKAFLADALKSLSGLYYHTGKLAEALAVITESVQLLEDLSDIEHLPAALMTQADIYMTEGKLHLVAEVSEKALEVLRGTKGQNLDVLSSCLDRLISVAIAKDDLDTAGQLAQEKADLDRQIRPEDQQQAALNSYNLAFVAFNKDKPEPARTYLESSLPLFPTNSPGAIKTLTLLCKVCLALEDLESAELYADRLISQAVEVKDYPDLPGVYLDYGTVKEQREKEAAALEAYWKCVELERNKPTDCSAFSYMNIGQIYAKQNDFVRAEENYKKGCDLYMKRTQGISPEIAILLHNLATIQTSAEKLDSAERNYMKSLEVKLKFCEEKSETVLETQLCLAGVLIREKKFSEAEMVLRRCISRHDGEQRKSAAALLALALDQQGRAAEAEEMARQYNSKS